MENNLWCWEGMDADLEVSVTEYGLAWCRNEHCETEQQLFFIYRQFGDLYGCAYHKEVEADNIIKGKDWARERDVKSFLSTMGMTNQEWLGLSHGQKVYDLVQYWGIENIFGSDYNPHKLTDYFFWNKHPIF